jgi:hypothetical protein
MASYSIELRVCRSKTGNIRQSSLSAADHDLQYENVIKQELSSKPADFH